jgi:hypothetical protein
MLHGTKGEQEIADRLTDRWRVRVAWPLRMQQQMVSTSRADTVWTPVAQAEKHSGQDRCFTTC